MQMTLTLVGIGLDFLGFYLLLREWWVAFLGQSRQVELERARARQAGFQAFIRRSASGDHAQHLDRFAEMDARRMAAQDYDREIADLKARRRLFMVSAALIILGSFLQLLGALPAAWVTPATDIWNAAFSSV